MRVNPCLTFNGQCRAAFKFYEQCLGGKIQTLMTWGESPMAEHVPAEFHDRIIHTTLIVGDTELMGGDAPPDRFEAPKGFSVTVQTKDVAEAEKVFAALAVGGTVHMPIQETFWSPRFGMLVDQFGVPWMINCAAAA